MAAKPKQNSSGGSKGSGSNSAHQRQALPFEPKNKQVEKQPTSPSRSSQPQSSSPKNSQNSKSSKAASSQKATRGAGRSNGGIPEAVSRRMIRRIALFSGVPTALGMSTFVASYLAVSHEWLVLPTYVVLLVSLGWFGLGVLGVSFGVLSASWDEETPGSWLGFSEFKTNWGRMTEAWRSNKQARS